MWIKTAPAIWLCKYSSLNWQRHKCVFIPPVQTPTIKTSAVLVVQIVHLSRSLGRCLGDLVCSFIPAASQNRRSGSCIIVNSQVNDEFFRIISDKWRLLMNAGGIWYNVFQGLRLELNSCLYIWWCFPMSPYIKWSMLNLEVEACMFSSFELCYEQIMWRTSHITCIYNVI